jgi:SAM-dependent methyltransferase
MTGSEASTKTVGTTSDDSEEYDAAYPGHGDDDGSDQSRRDFFTQVASRVVALTNARSVLDIGCGDGMLVQAFAGLGVDVRGIDTSAQAIASAHPDVRDRLSVGSATQPIEGRYDLITCIEVVEHLDARDAETALDQMCAATDVILFASTPGRFDDPTRVNVRPTAEWVAGFSDRGFFRRIDVNLDFLSPSAVLLRRADLTPRDVVHLYEDRLAPLRTEVDEKRSALREAHREITRLSTDPTGTPSARERLLALQGRLDEQLQRVDALEQALLEARHDRLTVRDHIIGLEARAEELTRKLKVHQIKLNKQQERAKDLQAKLAHQRRRASSAERQLDEMRASRSWRWGRALTRPFRLLSR